MGGKGNPIWEDKSVEGGIMTTYNIVWDKEISHWIFVETAGGKFCGAKIWHPEHIMDDIDALLGVADSGDYLQLFIERDKRIFFFSSQNGSTPTVMISMGGQKVLDLSEDDLEIECVHALFNGFLKSFNPC